MQSEDPGAPHAPLAHADHPTDHNPWSDLIDILSETAPSGGYGLSWLIDRMTGTAGQATREMRT
ncbi:hypothetical protein [uncultured Maritimibacter sp.]|jgi:hypothetical protein|uniref:hypothetical protein n=1 Tax=uncultured Maritimibacter sp. TaxID=991866 RepID=UPI002639F047|nr:hypothetical protein [uncultured Maritimibacter sp.]